jgi:hypothetical protein
MWKILRHCIGSGKRQRDICPPFGAAEMNPYAVDWWRILRIDLACRVSPDLPRGGIRVIAATPNPEDPQNRIDGLLPQSCHTIYARPETPCWQPRVPGSAAYVFRLRGNAITKATLLLGMF